jgi:hypothetical protein
MDRPRTYRELLLAKTYTLVCTLFGATLYIWTIWYWILFHSFVNFFFKMFELLVEL